MAADLSVVICTYQRPGPLRLALDAVAAQTYPGTIETIVVFDKSEPDHSLALPSGPRPVVVVANDRTPGLPGGRNAGLAHATAPVLALCDDDDRWLPTKVARQLAVLSERPDVDVVMTGMRAHTDGASTDRVPPGDTLTFGMLLADRVASAHISSAMFRRDAFEARIGRFDEAIPGGYCEDYEWTLRAARAAPIAVIREPLVEVSWGVGSHFADRWRTIDEALGYLLERYPEFGAVPRGRARVQGQRAFARAGAGDPPWSLVRATLRDDWRQPRAYLAALVALHLVKPERVLRALHRRGRGI